MKKAKIIEAKIKSLDKMYESYLALVRKIVVIQSVVLYRVELW